MGGIYIHIPFCRKVCFYCDFHFTVSLKNKHAIVAAICQEIKLRKQYLNNETIETVYFGGGTPSVLNIDEINMLFSQVKSVFNVLKNAEITLEANPDDLTPAYLEDLKNYTAVNRLSIGIQSFNDKALIWMNRRHTGQQAKDCLEQAHKKGFTNLNADLIYGIPNMTQKQWQNDIDVLLKQGVPHISAYHLTIEPNTIFGRRKKKGLLAEIKEDESWQHFETLLNALELNGYEHYEISNFAKNKQYSKHNTNYWKYGKYLGLGPSAHSFNGQERQWNCSVNAEYLKGIEAKGGYFELEHLSATDKFNEFIMVGLRTQWGIDEKKMEQNFEAVLNEKFKNKMQPFVNSGHVIKHHNCFVLTRKGKFIADYIIGELFA